MFEILEDFEGIRISEVEIARRKAWKERKFQESLVKEIELDGQLIKLTQFEYNYLMEVVDYFGIDDPIVRVRLGEIMENRKAG